MRQMNYIAHSVVVERMSSVKIRICSQISVSSKKMRFGNSMLWQK